MKKHKTLLSQMYIPRKKDVIYHYCSVENLESIIRNKRMRFSDINMMNDAAEFNWSYHLFEEAANELLRESKNNNAISDIDAGFFDRVDEIVSNFQMFMHPIVACFSRTGDLLSQWSRYADDGRGVSIGFSAKGLVSMPITLLSALYGKEGQLKAMKNQLVAMYFREKDRALGKHISDDEGFWFDCQMLVAYFPAFKHPSFSEEREVRGVHLLNVNVSDDGLFYSDPGGVSNGTPVTGESVQFRVRNGEIIMYVDLPFGGESPAALIPEIVLGPRTPSAPGNFRALLCHHGFTNTLIKTSSSTYR